MSQNTFLGFSLPGYFSSSHKTESGSPTSSHGLGEDRRGKAKRRDDRSLESERRSWKLLGSHKGGVEEQGRQIRLLEKRLEQTEELLNARTEELSGTETFLSTRDHLSEEEVLEIVRDLNQNIYQVAVRLTEEWEKLDPPPTTSQREVDPTSQNRVPALIQLVRNRNSTGLLFQLQSCLCSQVVSMTSSWGRHQELAVLESVYERLSASEGQAISARWRSLTHSYLLQPPPHSASLVEKLADVLYETGSFSSPRQSLDFVQAATLKGIDRIVRLSLSLESVFMVEVTSSDMSVLFEAPDTEFDGARMIDEFESGRRDKVAGVTEMGVKKSVCGRPGEGRRVEILLKTKVVLERDVLGLQLESCDQRNNAGNDSESRNQGDIEGDKELAVPKLGGDEAGNLKSGEEMLLEEEDEAEVSTTIGQDWNVTNQVGPEVELEIDSVIMELCDQRTHAGNDSEGRNQGDNEGDEELVGLELGGDEAGNLKSGEEMPLEEDDEAEVSTTIGQDGNVASQVELEIDSVAGKSRNQGDTEGDEELAGPKLGEDKAWNLRSGEEMPLEGDDEAGVPATIGQDGNVTNQVELEVESEIDQHI